jgi:hypothetical protein
MGVLLEAYPLTRFRDRASSAQPDQAQQTRDLTSRMRKIRMSGSVGASEATRQLPGVRAGRSGIAAWSAFAPRTRRCP